MRLIIIPLGSQRSAVMAVDLWQVVRPFPNMGPAATVELRILAEAVQVKQTLPDRAVNHQDLAEAVADAPKQYLAAVMLTVAAERVVTLISLSPVLLLLIITGLEQAELTVPLGHPALPGVLALRELLSVGNITNEPSVCLSEEVWNDLEP